MSLSTNSWDIVYTSELDSINRVLSQEYTPKIATIPANRFELTITIIKGEIIIANCTDKALQFKLTIEGSYVVIADPMPRTAKPFDPDTAITFNIDIEPSSPTLGTLSSSSQSGSLNSVSNLGDDFSSYCNANNKFIQKYFSSLTIFSGLQWIDIAICKVAIQLNKYLNNKKYISFCYMLSRKEKDTNGIEVEKAINYNDPYVDFNAIPEGATSALIIERSVFAEHMVKPVFGTTNDFSDGLDAKLGKSGTYAFTNKEEVTLKSKDYLNESDTPVAGTVASNRMLISVEEINIKLSMGDVGYQYNSKNNPTINQEYVFNLGCGDVNVTKPDPNDKTKTITIKEKGIITSAKERLFIISNNFKPYVVLENLINIGLPIIKNIIVDPLNDGRRLNPKIENFMVVKPKPQERKKKSSQMSLAKVVPIVNPKNLDISTFNNLRGSESNSFTGSKIGNQQFEASEISSKSKVVVNAKGNSSSRSLNYGSISQNDPIPEEDTLENALSNKSNREKENGSIVKLDKGYLHYLHNANTVLLNKMNNWELKIGTKSDNLKAEFIKQQTFLKRNNDFWNQKISGLNGINIVNKCLNRYQTEVNNAFNDGEFEIGDYPETEGDENNIYFFKHPNAIITKIKDEVDKEIEKKGKWDNDLIQQSIYLKELIKNLKSHCSKTEYSKIKFKSIIDNLYEVGEYKEKITNWKDIK